MEPLCYLEIFMFESKNPEARKHTSNNKNLISNKLNPKLKTNLKTKSIAKMKTNEIDRS